MSLPDQFLYWVKSLFSPLPPHAVHEDVCRSDTEDSVRNVSVNKFHYALLMRLAVRF